MTGPRGLSNKLTIEFKQRCERVERYVRENSDREVRVNDIVADTGLSRASVVNILNYMQLDTSVTVRSTGNCDYYKYRNQEDDELLKKFMNLARLHAKNSGRINSLQRGIV